MRAYATKPWSNATLSFYPATVGVETWMLLDNAVLQRTPGAATVGTECEEPAQPIVMLKPSAIGAPVSGRSLGEIVEITGAAGAAAEVVLGDAIDRAPGAARALTFRSRLRSTAPGQVQVSRDGVNWTAVALVPPSDGWELVRIALDEFAGAALHVRFVVSADPGDDSTPIWQIAGMHVGR
jgi:hypothetical protein